jgi:SAM-dependent methyltransferase
MEAHPWQRLLPPLAGDVEFAAVRALFDRCGFTSERVCERFGLAEINDFKAICQGRTTVHEAEQPLDALILLLMDGEYVARATLERLLPEGALGALETLGLALSNAARPELCYAPFLVMPVEGMRLASDRMSAPDHSPFTVSPDVVYPAAMEQTGIFVKTIARTPCEALLDIGTGTGIAALAAAGFARQAWGTDIASRSVRFAEFNRRLNGVGNAVMIEGDLYQPVDGLTFDRIVTHPPYVPARRTALIYRDGGEDGEQILRRVVEGLPRFLRPGGRFQTLVTAADCEGQPFEDRVRLWLGEAEAEFDVVMVSYSLTAPKDLLANSLFRRNTTVDDILYRQEVWDRRKVQLLFYGSVVIRRHAAARPAFTARVQKGEGYTPRHAEWLLDWTTEARDPAACERLLELRPSLSPHAQLGVFHRVTNGRFAAEAFSLRSDGPFETELVPQSWLAQIVSQCDGRTTWREHLENAKAAGMVDPATTPQEFLGLLEHLVANGLLWVAERPLP